MKHCQTTLYTELDCFRDFMALWALAVHCVCAIVISCECEVFEASEIFCPNHCDSPENCLFI